MTFEPKWAALPNAEAHPRPYNGPLPAVHVAVEDNRAACNRRLLLNDTLVWEPAKVDYLARCRRSGCRQRFVEANKEAAR